MNEFRHIHQDFRHVMALSSAERINFMMQPRWLPYPASENALGLLTRLMDTPKRYRMPNLLLVTAPFNGKTTILRYFEKKHGTTRRDEHGALIRPALYVESPNKANEKELYAAIIEAFDAPCRATLPVVALAQQAVHLCRASGVQIILFDEFHSLLSGTARQQREIMNVIKRLCNVLRIPLVGAGTRAVVQAISTDAQHASRFDVAELPLWQDDQNFKALLAQFEQVLPLRKPSNLSLPNTATLLHKIAGGNLGDLHRLLMICAEEAIITGQEEIDYALIKSKENWQRPSGGFTEFGL